MSKLSDLSELEPIEHELQVLFEERSTAVTVSSLPSMPTITEHSSTPITTRTPGAQRRDRQKFWMASAAAVALIVAAGWVLAAGLDSPASKTDAASDEDGGVADVPDDVADQWRLPADEIVDANPKTSEETAKWLTHWAIDGPYVVVTAADWCPHCQQHLPTLIDELEDLHVEEQRVEVLGVGAANDPIWAKVDWPFPVFELALPGSDEPSGLLPSGLDYYPAVAVWSSNGMVGESTSASDWTMDDTADLVDKVLTERD